MDYYVGDYIKMDDINFRCLNLIVSSCGTGKSYFCANELLAKYPEVRPEEVLFVTSRSLAADQQAHDYDLLIRYDRDDPINKFWDGECDIDNYCDVELSQVCANRIRIMTYDKIISILFGKNYAHYNCHALDNVRIVIFDEIHSLYSDSFIAGASSVQMYMSYEIPKGDKLFVGLTATPGILLDQADKLGVDINIINEPIQRYKARQLWCVDTQNLVKLVNDEFEGKTIIMCRSIRGCYSLAKMIPGSAVLAGKSGNDYIPCDMDEIRNSIVDHSVLPDNVRVLISTSTAREGFNFVEDSNIRNVVLYFHDELYCHQFLGRCRYDVDNLVMVKYDRKSADDDYFGIQEAQFERFCEDPACNTEWFEHVSDILYNNCDNTIFRFAAHKKSIKRCSKPKSDNPSIGMFATRDSMLELRKYISGYCVKHRSADLFDDVDNGKIIYGARKDKILEDVKSLNIFTDEYADITWRKLERVVSDMGYKIYDGRRTILGERVRYKVLYTEDGD